MPSAPAGHPPTEIELLDLQRAAGLPVAEVERILHTSSSGLNSSLAAARLAQLGPNVIRSAAVHAPAILLRQLKNPMLLLLGATAITAFFFGERRDALVILAIVFLSVGLGFFNEYASERALAGLRSRISHRVLVTRDGKIQSLDVSQLVPGDLVSLDVGDVVPADLRLVETHAVECDEAVLTGESMTSSKTSSPTTASDSPLKLPSCVYMGTVVRGGTGKGLVVRTGADTAFGRIAVHLAEGQQQTGFQRGLRDFSLLLVRVTAVLTISIFVFNALLGRPLIEAALFALAVAVGLTPQLLPAIVSISLSFGARGLARRSVLVKRLVSIEDLGNIEVLFTDKTGTLTEGTIELSDALDIEGKRSADLLVLGLVCNSASVVEGRAVAGNPLDQAIWVGSTRQSRERAQNFKHLAEAPFDYDRKLMSVLVDTPTGERLIICKGAPEAVLARCSGLPEGVEQRLQELFNSGQRVVAMAQRPAPGLSELSVTEERDLQLAGLLIFSDPLKADAAGSLAQLRRLEVRVKIVTGDNDRVARRICEQLGVEVDNVLLGTAVDQLSDQQLKAALPSTTIFARVTPEHKSRIIQAQRSLGTDVAFLGDGVNDAVALHDADVGISVDSATDVAKDAADIVLLDKDLGILAQGVIEGRRIFSNTIKYVLMGTSSNFGNMFSAAGASLFLPFLPMTPGQILFNNLLYDVSEMTIPSDRVDPELLARPAHWDMRFIRRFMLFFGPISSVFDFMTFFVMLWVFHATHSLFQTGWFVESLSTQTLVIFVIRTRRLPFFSSRPSLPLLVTSVACVAIGATAPFTPLASLFGFSPLPIAFFGALLAMIVTYLFLAELGKAIFFRPMKGVESLSQRHSPAQRHLLRRALRFGIAS